MGFVLSPCFIAQYFAFFQKSYNSLNGEERAGRFGFLVFLVSCGCCHSLPLLCGTLSGLWCALMAFPSHAHLPFHIYYND